VGFQAKFIILISAAGIPKYKTGRVNTKQKLLQASSYEQYKWQHKRSIKSKGQLY
jgi:hypothetical protein